MIYQCAIVTVPEDEDGVELMKIKKVLLAASTRELKNCYFVPGFNGTYGSYYKTGLSDSGTYSILMPSGIDTNFILSTIVPVQDMYCDLYYVLACASTCYLPTLQKGSSRSQGR